MHCSNCWSASCCATPSRSTRLLRAPGSRSTSASIASGCVATSQDLLDRYASLPIGDVDVAALIADLFEVLQRHHVRVPPELLLMGKALATVDGLARDLDPTLDPIEAVRPYVLNVLAAASRRPALPRARLDPHRNDIIETATTLPGDLRAIVARSAPRRTAHRDAHEGLELLVREQARSANRQLLALLDRARRRSVPSILLASGAGAMLGPLPITAWLGLAGLVLSGSGFWLLAYGVLRSGRF